MRLGKLAVIGLAALVGLGLGLIVAQPWHGPTDVEAVELDDEKAWREDDGSDAEVREDDGDDALRDGIRRRGAGRCMRLSGHCQQIRHHRGTRG